MVGTYDLIKQAIQSRSQIHARYNGHSRELCPHVLGTKNSRQQCLFYQFGGSSSSGLAPAGSGDNWRCIPLGGLTQVRLVEGKWHTAPNHSRPQTCVDNIAVEVSH